MKSIQVGLVAALAGGWLAAQEAAPPRSESSQAILRDLENFRQLGSVLYIAAHPDDENSELIAYLARGRHYRTAYLSLTRGDGGQNVLGPDFGEKLGVARTQELLAARRVDGGRQFFSRAVDFGFSKDYRETLNFWDREGVVSDIVRVIRTFRPDVLVTRFSPIPGGTHGHHTASAILAIEAFKLAGDPKAFPDQLKSLTPWQPARILWNGSSFEGNKSSGTNQIRIDAGGRDPISGEAFSEIAARSRAMHKTQGLGGFRGSGAAGGPRMERFQLLGGSPVTNDIMDGVDTNWDRIAGGAAIGEMAGEIIAHFAGQNPAASVPALLRLRARLADLNASDPVIAGKKALLDRIVQHCLGIEIHTTLSPDEAVPGEQVQLRETAAIQSDIPVQWVAGGKATPLTKGEGSSFDTSVTLPANTPLTQPYWLREEGTTGMSRVDDPSLIGRPENLPVLPVNYTFETGGQTLVIPDDSARLDVIPPVWIHFVSDVELFAPGASRAVQVELTAARADTGGTLQLEAPAGWQISPAQAPFHLTAAGDRTRMEFTIAAPADSATARITASVEVNGARYRNDREIIAYSHIPRQLLQPVAQLKAVSLEMGIRGRTVGYLPGAGDSIAENLRQMGYTVRTLEDTNLTAEELRGLDAVVIGVRAFNVRRHIGECLPALFDYVKNGGTVVAQYNRPNGLQSDQLAPYDLHLSNERVTDETAAVTFLAPDSPVLNTPNKITEADFAGWIQERGIYFPDEWDEHFTPILACHDPGESPLKGSLLVAQYGKGHFVYTGLVFFRQLPAGVPGAYRLFANLVSLGK